MLVMVKVSVDDVLTVLALYHFCEALVYILQHFQLLLVCSVLIHEIYVN